MNPLFWRNWMSCLGLAGVCMIFVGCGGGGDVPDPDSDTQVAAAPEAAPTPVAAPPAVPASKADEAESPAEPVAAQPTPPVVSEPTPAPAKAEAPAARPMPEQLATTANAPAQASESKPAADSPESVPAAAPSPAKPDTGATTTEMLALSATNVPAPPTGANDSGTNPAGAGANPAGGSVAPNSATPAGPGRRRDDVPAAMVPPGPSGRDARAAQEGPRKDDEYAAAQPTGVAGRVGGREGLGSTRDSGPADYTNPHTAVKEFLAALEDKNVERLSEATALRAPDEAVAKHQDLFRKILDGSISEAQLTEIAELLDGYSISGEGQVKSTGRLSILISKQTDNGRLQRTVTVRKEKAGWKVLDISAALDFRNPSRNIRNRPRGGSNR